MRHQRSPQQPNQHVLVRTVVPASNRFFANPHFLAYVLLMWSDTTVKKDSPLHGIQAQEMTACSTHPDCPSHSLIVSKLNDGIISQRHSWWTRNRLCAETLEPTQERQQATLTVVGFVVLLDYHTFHLPIHQKNFQHEQLAHGACFNFIYLATPSL